MKKLIILLLLATSAKSQIYVSTGIDFRNAIVGSKPTDNKPALDLLFKVHLVGQNVECTIQYERFEAIGFDKFAFGVGYQFKAFDTTITPSIEPTLIGRNNFSDFDTKSSHLALGSSLTIKYDISDKTGIGLAFNALYRTDLAAKYGAKNPMVYSNYLTVFYKIN